mgnify:CR=1 FL=1
MSRPYGPRPGDIVELGDTRLKLRIPARVPDAHQELHVGFAKTGRDGLGLQARGARETCDVLITNVVVLDPVDGVRVASIGIRDGRISGIGKAGNPDTADNIDIVAGTGTIVIDGEGLIATPGGIDTHVHTLSPRVLHSEISSGVTTVIAQEAGPFWGVGLGSAWVIDRGLRAMDAFPLNIGLLGRGSSSRADALRECLDAHVCGLKVHEDTGATLRTIDTALSVAEERDIQVALHTDGLNESLSVADTLAVLDGRAVHAYHVEGCGGGHAPDVLTLAGIDNVLASSTNPTLPYGANAVAEHLDMILLCHGMDAGSSSDVRIARARVRGATMAAEGRLHDLGVIGVTSSDAQGMGRAHVRAGQRARRARRGARRRRQRPDPALPGQDHDQPRARARPRARGRAPGGGAPGRHRAVAPGVLRGHAAAGRQGRLPRVGCHRRSQCRDRLRRTAGDGTAVRRVRRGAVGPVGAVLQRRGGRGSAAGSGRSAHGGRARLSHRAQFGTRPARRARASGGGAGRIGAGHLPRPAAPHGPGRARAGRG